MHLFFEIPAIRLFRNASCYNCLKFDDKPFPETLMIIISRTANNYMFERVTIRIVRNAAYKALQLHRAIATNVGVDHGCLTAESFAVTNSCCSSRFAFASSETAKQHLCQVVPIVCVFCNLSKQRTREGHRYCDVPCILRQHRRIQQTYYSRVRVP